MNKLKKFTKLLILSVIITGVISCDKKEANITFEVVGDVFISKRLINDEVHFALVYYAYGNQSMSSATVFPEGGEEIQLEPLDNPKHKYGIQPTIDDFSTEFPEIGIFDFKVVNEGIEHTTSDVLLLDNLEIPNIISAEYNSSRQTIMVEWESVPGSQSYIVKLVKDNGDIVFAGQLLNDLATVYEVDSNLGTWFETPVSGTTYNLEVHSYFYEAEAEYSDYMYHIQENSIGEMEVIWGE